MLSELTGATPDLRTNSGSTRAVALALHLPPALTGRSFGSAWLLAVVLHLVLLAAALISSTREVEVEPPPVRMVFMEPPPPPPAPLGVPEGMGTVPTLVDIKPEPVVQRPKEAPKPVVADPSRLKKAEAKSKPKPKVEPKVAPPAPVAEAPVPVAEVAPGVRTGSADGVAGGVVGGVDGGLVGGVVGGTGTEPVPLGQVATLPRVVHSVEPKYPDVARRRGVKGTVLIEAILDREGRVEPAVKVLQSVPMLDEAAITAVRKWRFTPGRNSSGATVRVLVSIPFVFKIR